MSHRILAVILFTFVAAVSVSEAREPKWVQRLPMGNVREGNLNFDVAWDKREGARFRIAQSQGAQAVEITMNPRRPSVILQKNLKDKGEPLPRVHYDMEALPGLDVTTEATLKIRRETWALYLEDQVVVQFKAPFTGPLTLWQPASELPARSSDDAVYFQKTGEFHFGADFLIPEGQDNPLADWVQVSGEWGVHSILEDVMAEAPTDRIKARPLEAERSPNFYCLLGSGEKAMILHGYDFYDDYKVEAAMLTAPGESGLVFYYSGERDYYTLTLHTESADSTYATVQLWRNSSTRLPRVKMLAETTVPVTANQWVKPAVKVWDNHIVCFLDESELFRVQESLPVGGSFGVWADSETPLRFDDVAASSIRELNLTNTDQIAFHMLASRGEFFQTSSFLGLFRQPLATQNSLPVPMTASDKWLLVGSYEDQPHVFAATFKPRGFGAMGLVLGYTGADESHLRLHYATDRHNEIFTLQKVSPGKTEDLQQFRLPLVADGAGSQPVRLMADATESGILRLYRNGEMVFAHYPETVPFVGASGIFVGANTDVTIADMIHRSDRQGVYRNQYEKNRIYAEDPFMRHWSSPEGQWHTDEDGLTWHKSDFFGRFDLAMSYAADSQIHLGVAEDRTDGAVILVAKDGKLEFHESNGTETTLDAPVATGTIPKDAMALAESPPENPHDRLPTYTLHYEGYWVWVTCGREVVVSHRLSRPLDGRRIRIQGFSTDDLMTCAVDVYNVKDYLFNRAITDWTRNGGTWEVVNRFQCDPRWSHMNGESKNDFAALWAKYRFRGDFCVEMYAGLRHGWYDRCGDINITMMNDTTSPSSGYTITTTGWDNDHSQNATRFYRNGELLQESDKYLIPRYRAGNTRKYKDPLLQGGRDVHGAWYYLKLRRIGNTVEFWFDNELIFRVEETKNNRLDDGGMGIWTYMNSIVVARVKIAAEHIEPRVLETKPLAARTIAATNPVDVERHSRLLANGQPLQTMLPRYWSVDDPVGFTTLEWHEDQGERPYFVATNTLGNGRMFVAADLPPMKMKDLAGWAIQLKRTEDAVFNFHYAVGHMDGENFVATDQRYLRISGPVERRNGFTHTGTANVSPAVSAPGDEWHTYSAWSRIHAWLPIADYTTPSDDVYVKVLGFGLAQPSYDMQGLTGNGPGAAYAVAAVTPIAFQPPMLTRNPEHSSYIPRSFLIIWPENDRLAVRDESLSSVAAALANDSRAGINRRIVRAVFSGGVSDTEVDWVNLPTDPSWTVEWDTDTAGAFLVKNGHGIYDRRLYTAPVTVRGVTLESESVDPFTRRCFLPRIAEWNDAAREPLQVQIGQQTHVLDWSKRKPERPALLSVDGFSPFILTFESQTYPEPVMPTPDRMAIQRDDQQGSHLTVWNLVRNQRLTSAYKVPFDLAEYPVFRLRYRAEAMSRVDLRLNRADLHFLEPDAGATVRLATEAKRDNEWQSWTGMVSDVLAGDQFQSRRFYPGSLQILSVGSKDQTGDRGEIAYDDMVFGPATNRAEDLTFTPHYMDYGGVKAVFYAVHPGPQSYDEMDSANRREVQWQEVAAGAPITPDTASLPQGLNYVLLKAVDTDGRDSGITSLPFIWDTEPLSVSHNFHVIKEPWTNGTVVRTVFSAGPGAPLDLDDVTVNWNGTPVRMNASYNRFTQSADSGVALINWPFELRAFLDKMKDGESGTLSISGIVDGAGNPSPDVEIPITIKYAGDKTGPSLLRPTLPKTVAYSLNWYGQVSPSAGVKPGKRQTATLVDKWQEEPYIVSKAHQNDGSATLSARGNSWRLEDHPYFAFRMRRPDVPKKDEVQLRLDIRYTNKKTDVVYLTVPENDPKGRQAVADRPVTWTPGEWQTVSVDLVKALESRLKGDRLKEAVVSTVTIHRLGTRHEEKLDIMAATGFGPWQATDTIRLQGYDASGVRGLEWEYVDAAAKVLKTGSTTDDSLKPASLGLPASPGSWLVIYLVDHAGNRSTPLRIPYQP